MGELSARGWTQTEIAAELRVSQAAVSKILDRIERTSILRSAEALERCQARQQIQLRHLYRESLRAWDQSKRGRIRKRQRRTNVGTLVGAELAELTTDDIPGDPRYLEMARKALEDERKLVGLNSPTAGASGHQSRPVWDPSDQELKTRVATLAESVGFLVTTRPLIPKNPVTPPPDTPEPPRQERPLTADELAELYAAELRRREAEQQRGIPPTVAPAPLR